MLTFESTQKGLPAIFLGLSGNPPNGPGGYFDNHGWYSQIAPHIGYESWASLIDFTSSFSSVRNEAARRAGMNIKIHECPSDRGLQHSEWLSSTWCRVLCNYVANGGNTNAGQTDVAPVTSLGGPFALSTVGSLGKITDGTSNTLLMSEAWVLSEPKPPFTWGGAYSDIITALGAHVFTGYNPPNAQRFHDQIGYGWGILNGATNADATARYKDAGFTDDNIPQPGGGGALGTYIAARSKHRGGVNASRCDGSVSYVSDSISPLIWRALTSAARWSGSASSMI